MIFTINCANWYDGHETMELLRFIFLKKLHSNSEEDEEILNKKKSVLFLVEIFDELYTNSRDKYCEVDVAHNDYELFIKEIRIHIEKFPNIVLLNETQELYLCQMIAMYFLNIKRDPAMLKKAFEELDAFLKYFLKDNILEEFFENFSDSKVRNTGVLLRLLQLDLRKMEDNNFSPLLVCNFWINFNNWKQSYYFHFNSRLKNLTEIERHAYKYLERLIVKENIEKLKRICCNFDLEPENRINYKKINKILTLMIKNLLENPENIVTKSERDDISFIFSYFIRNSMSQMYDYEHEYHYGSNLRSNAEQIQDSLETIKFIKNPEKYYEEFIANGKVGICSQFIIIARDIIEFSNISGERFPELLDILKNFEFSKKCMEKLINFAQSLIHRVVHRNEEYIPEENSDIDDNVSLAIEKFLGSPYFASFISNIIEYYKGGKK